MFGTQRLDEIQRQRRKLADDFYGAQEVYRAQLGDLQFEKSNADLAGDRNELRLKDQAIAALSATHEQGQTVGQEQLESLQEEFEALVVQDHMSKKAIVIPEVALDVWRLGPPLVFGLVVLIFFGQFFS